MSDQRPPTAPFPPPRVSPSHRQARQDIATSIYLAGIGACTESDMTNEELAEHAVDAADALLAALDRR